MAQAISRRLDSDELVARVADLERRLAVLETTRRPVRNSDRALLVALRDAFGAHAFLSSDVVELARADERLRVALAASGVEGVVAIGHRLSRLAGRPIDGWQLERLPRENGGRGWIVSLDA